jgi:hypothetical protein
VPDDRETPRIPVMAHLTAVALTVQRAGWDDETVAAAFLHDVLEDGNVFGDHMSERSLRILMGDAVAERVLGVTEPKFGQDGQHLPWRTRKQTYLETLRKGPMESIAISLADKKHNAWTMAQGLETGFDIFSRGPARRALSAGPEDQIWFYRAVLTVSETFDDPRLERLRDELLEEVERFEELVGQGRD